MLSGLLLGPLGGLFAGGVGSAMGDVALGYIHFAPITLVVKGCEGMIVGFASRQVRMGNRLTKLDIAGLIAASLTMMLGYFFAEIALFGFWIAVAELITLNWIQVTAGSIITALTGPAIRDFLRDYVYESQEADTWTEGDISSSIEIS
jgi:uncharacterized membrane protein